MIYSSRGRRFIYCSIRAHSSCIGIKVGGRNLQIQSRANSFNTIYTTATCSTPSIIIYFKCSLTTSTWRTEPPIYIFCIFCFYKFITSHCKGIFCTFTLSCFIIYTMIHYKTVFFCIQTTNLRFC